MRTDVNLAGFQVTRVNVKSGALINFLRLRKAFMCRFTYFLSLVQYLTYFASPFFLKQYILGSYFDGTKTGFPVQRVFVLRSSFPSSCETANHLACYFMFCRPEQVLFEITQLVYFPNIDTTLAKRSLLLLLFVFVFSILRCIYRLNGLFKAVDFEVVARRFS